MTQLKLKQLHKRYTYYLFPRAGWAKKLGYRIRWCLKNKPLQGPDITIVIVGRIPWGQYERRHCKVKESI